MSASRRKGFLPRPGALVARALGQGEQIALVQPDAAGTDPLGRAVLGVAFLTTLAPSQRYCQEHRKLHQTLTNWARQLVLQVRRRLPQRELVLVTDSAFAALDLLAALMHQAAICVTQPRFDAVLDEAAPPRRPGTKGHPAAKGLRLPNLAEVLAATTTR